MPKKLVVVITGSDDSGKSTLAWRLRQELCHHGRYVQVLSFATPVKDVVAYVLDTPRDKLELLKKLPETNMRKLIVEVATAFREYCDSIFADKVVGRVKQDRDGIYIIDDLRYDVEHDTLVECVESSDFEVVKVTTPITDIHHLSRYLEQQWLNCGEGIQHGINWKDYPST